jgi:hypothetical protein
VFSNNQADSPAITNALLAHGTGITPAGGVANVIERNLVYDHDRVGIAIAPFPEENPNDLIPPQDEWDLDCETARLKPLPAEIPTEDLFLEEFLVWEAWDNVIRDNVISGSGQADIGVGSFTVPTQDLRNCFEGNTFETSSPDDIETLAPCDGEGSGDWEANAFDLIQLFTFEAPPSVDYQEAVLPDRPMLDGMEDPENAPANPALNMPPEIDLDAIQVPEAPEG